MLLLQLLLCLVVVQNTWPLLSFPNELEEGEEKTITVLISCRESSGGGCCHIPPSFFSHAAAMFLSLSPSEAFLPGNPIHPIDEVETRHVMHCHRWVDGRSGEGGLKDSSLPDGTFFLFLFFLLSSSRVPPSFHLFLPPSSPKKHTLREREGGNGTEVVVLSWC